MATPCSFSVIPTRCVQLEMRIVAVAHIFFPHKFAAADATVCLICSDPVGAAAAAATAAATAALITGLVGLVASPRARPSAVGRREVCTAAATSLARSAPLPRICPFMPPSSSLGAHPLPCLPALPWDVVTQLKLSFTAAALNTFIHFCDLRREVGNEMPGCGLFYHVVPYV